MSFPKNKRQALLDRDGLICWLCAKPIDASLHSPDPMSLSVDHYVPRKWGGNSQLLNLRLAHSRCNSNREKDYVATFYLSEDEVAKLTHPSKLTGGLSRKAQKAMSQISKMRSK